MEYAPIDSRTGLPSNITVNPLPPLYEQQLPIPYQIPNADTIRRPNSGLPENAAPVPSQPVVTDKGVEVVAQRPTSGMDEYLALAKDLYPDVEAPQMEQGKGFQFNIPGMEIPGVSPAIGAIPFVGKRLRGAIKKGFKPGMSGGMLDAVAQSILGSLQTMPEASGVGESFAKGLATGFGAVRGKDIEERKKRYEEGIAAKKEALKNQRTFAGELAKTAYEYGLKPKPEGKRMVKLTPQLRAWMRTNANVAWPDVITEVPEDQLKASLETKGGPDAAQRFDMGMKVGTAFMGTQEYKDLSAAQTAYRAMARALKENKSPASIKFMLTQINKLIDPSSVIREGEVKLWEQISPLVRVKFANAVNSNFMNGIGMSEAEINDVMDVANQIIDSRRESYRSVRNNMVNMGRSAGVDVSVFVPDIESEMPKFNVRPTGQMSGTQNAAQRLGITAIPIATPRPTADSADASGTRPS